MFLSADEIRVEIEVGRLVIEPFIPELLKPASYVLRLGDRWRQWSHIKKPISVWTPDASRLHLQPELYTNEITLQPGIVVLGSTAETIGLPNDLVGIVSTLSHLARFGLSTHLQAFLVSPGFGAHTPTALTLELVSFNPSPLCIKTGMPVCHLAFTRTSSAVSKLPLGRSIYEGHDSPAPPMLYEEFSSLGQLKGEDE